MLIDLRFIYIYIYIKYHYRLQIFIIKYVKAERDCRIY